MFVCGPTVQGLLHIGHARSYVFYDTLARYLAHLGYDVEFVMNITDIDDSITVASKRAKTDPQVFARKYAEAFLEDMHELRIASVRDYSKVSDYVAAMIGQAKSLVEKGFAYELDGNVLFDTSKFARYGRLSHHSYDELTLRPIEIFIKKKNLLDFRIWRPARKGDTHWPSPWGDGKPGWHIQDTAVTISHFGGQYDIHGGGYELVYPHHESEIAIGESLHPVHPFVGYWVHTGLVRSGGKKMSKSLGNVVTIRDAIAKFGVDTLRYYVLMHHYRRDMNFASEKLSQAHDDLSAIKENAAGVIPYDSVWGGRSASLSKFYAALNDDMDTPRAITVLCKAVDDWRKGNRSPSCAQILDAASRITGIDFHGK
jgi:cysteinyl-tRNA synthetase